MSLLCTFCLSEPSVTGFTGRRPYELFGIPEAIAQDFRAKIDGGFQACAACAQLIRQKDVDGLAVRTRELLMTGVAQLSVPDQIRQINLFATANIWQRLFWLGLTPEVGNIVNVAVVIDPAVQVHFALVGAAGAGAVTPTFANGVNLLAWPFGNYYMIEDLQSSIRRKGHATRVMALAAALADLHTVTLAGNLEVTVEDADGTYLDTGALRAWLGNFGFTFDDEKTPPVAVRAPRLNSDRLSVLEAVNAAEAALKQG